MQICACWCVRRTFSQIRCYIREIIRNAEVCAMVGIKYFVEDIWKKVSLGYLLIAVAVEYAFVGIFTFRHLATPSHLWRFMLGSLCWDPKTEGGWSGVGGVYWCSVLVFRLDGEHYI